MVGSMSRGRGSQLSPNPLPKGQIREAMRRTGPGFVPFFILRFGPIGPLTNTPAIFAGTPLDFGTMAQNGLMDLGPISLHQS